MAGFVTTRVAALAVGLALAACGGGGEAPPQPVDFQEVAVGAFSGVTEPRQVVVQDPAAWARLWQDHTANVHPAPPLPALDLQDRTLAAVFLGRSVACQRPEVVAVARTAAGHLRVSYRLAGPAPTELCPAVVMTPVHMVSFANPARLPVVFEQREPS